MGLFILVHRQAIEAASPTGKALGELGITHPHVQDRRASHRYSVEDSLYTGLVPGGLLLCPVYGLADPCHPWLLAVATELLVGVIGARLSRHGMISSAPAVVTPGHLKMYWRSCLCKSRLPGREVGHEARCDARRSGGVDVEPLAADHGQSGRVGLRIALALRPLHVDSGQQP